MIQEPLEGIVVEHLAPRIRVVTGRVAVRPDVQEVTGTVARRHVAEVEMRPLERFGFEGVGILKGRARRQGVPLKIELGRGENLREQIALVEGLRLYDFCGQRGGHGRTGFVVARVVRKHRRIAGPVLVELRGKLDKVARHLRTRQAGIHGVGEHAVQPVAELVEHGGDVVEAEQCGLARRGLLEVSYVEDHRQLAQQFRLADQHVHPRSAILVVALEVIAIPQRQRLRISVEDLEDAHVLLVNGNVLALFEGEAVELMRSVEDAVLEHVVQLEIGLDLRLVQVVFRLAHLLGVELPIPGLDGEPAMLRVNQGLDVLGFSRSSGRGSRHQRIEKMLRRLRRFCHLIGQVPCRVVGEAEQRGFFGAQLGEPRDNGARVVGVAALRAVPGVLKDRLARGAVGEKRQVRLLRGVLQRHQPTLLLARLCGLCIRGDLRLAQPGKCLFVRR